MSDISKRFDRVAAGYAAYRPTCPPELIAAVASRCAHHNAAWEVGCGSGQVTGMLARSFDHVLASDPAPSAIAVAAEKQIEGVRFEVGDASSCSLSDHAVDLIAASQAAHWFDMDAFAIEARRVGADGALVAFWCYDRPRVTAEVDAAVDHLYFDVLRGCWDSGRSHIDSRYADLPFPFDEIQLEIPAYEARWTADAMLGYLRTWSGVDALAERGGGDGVAIIEASVREAWGTGTRPVRWPTAIRAGLVSQ